MCGCRCEQQYRLHRLLAFDPNNECRGESCHQSPNHFTQRSQLNFPPRNLFRLVQLPLLLPLQVLWCPGSPQGDCQAGIAGVKASTDFSMLKGTRDPKKSDFSPAVQASHRLGPGPTHNRESESLVGTARESKDSKLSNHRLSHVPAVFPYEGRAALFAELQQYSDQVRF